ncbi:ABC transporter transmembrane region [Lachnospiraceae bacterium G11]|nr:ABC transporter transmembrane region [Lachnospiraceae bacterium G11]
MDIIKKLRHILDKKQKRGLVILGIMIFLGGIAETLSVSALIPMISIILIPETFMKIEIVRDVMDYLNITETRTLIFILLFGLMAVFALKNLYLLALTKVQSKYIATNRNKMISKVLRQFLYRPYEFYLDADIPTVFRLTDSDIPQTFGLILAILNLSSELIVAIFLTVLMFVNDWKMTSFLMVVCLLITLLLTKVVKPKLADIGEKNLHVQSRIAKWRIQAIYGIKDVKVLHREDFFADNYENNGKIGATYSEKYSVLNGLPRLLIETVFMIGILAYIAFYMASGGDMSDLILKLTGAGAAAMRLMPSVNRINTYLGEIAYHTPSMNYLYENIRLNESYEKRVSDGKTGAIDLKNKIALKDITYAYPNTDTNIFTNASMEVPAGKSVGIIGSSGAGKSTLVDILLGLLTVKQGEITCDGVNIFDHYEEWLSHIGYIPQSIYLVDESIRDNIAFGIDADKISDDRIWAVLEEAQLKEFVKTLPEGLDTKVGDRGVRLSGGQRQRIGIARALYHNPDILVFDEATSALDNETEAALMEAINNFHGRKTMIIIAHRLNTIKQCDYVYKVQDGKIIPTTLENA